MDSSSMHECIVQENTSCAEDLIRKVIPLGAVLSPYGRFYPVDRNKKPVINSFKTDPAELAEMHKFERWLRNPDVTGWGFRMDSPYLIVIDCEHPSKHGVDRPGPNGMCIFEEFWRTHIAFLPDHLTVRSASGGVHHYFLFSPDLIPAGKRLRAERPSFPGSIYRLVAPTSSSRFRKWPSRLDLADMRSLPGNMRAF
jgi:hypothetical protein